MNVREERVCLCVCEHANYISRESYRRREMYIGHARLCVCVRLFVYVRRRISTLLHGSE